MLDGTVTWVGGGLALVIIYVVVSNTFWLLFGSRLAQSLPGVNISGFRGTVKIATMLVLSALGIIRWIVKYAFVMVTRRGELPTLSIEVSRTIKLGARLIGKRNDSDLSA